MATLQVKGMDDALYRALGSRAARDRRSVSQEVVSMIEAFLAQGPRPTRRAAEAFLELAGTWHDERSAVDIAKAIRASRRSKDRSRRLRDVLA